MSTLIKNTLPSAGTRLTISFVAVSIVGGFYIADAFGHEVVSALRVKGDGEAGQIVVTNKDNEAVMTLMGRHATTNAAQIRTGGKGTNGLVVVADSHGRGQIWLAGDSGKVTAESIRLTGGNDLAETFPTSSRVNVEPGTVVSIDPINAGNVMIASQPYDRRVVGITSGANGVSPGITLTAPDSELGGNLTVALSGRVFANADATFGAIEPGDLMTTSPTPGFLMKVRDYERANGAIVGKAMTSLSTGKGQVLVLVSLQ